MKKIFLALVFVLFSSLSLSAQGLSEETKTILLGKINSKTSYTVLDSIKIFKVFEAIPLLEQHFGEQPAFTSNKTYFLETLDTLNAPNLLSLSHAFLDSLKAGKFTFTEVKFESIGKTIPYYEGIGSAMQAFRICFKKNDFSRVEYFFEYLNNLKSIHSYGTYLQPMLVLAKNQEYKERLRPYFETIFKKVSSEWPKAIYLEKYHDLYKDETLPLAKYVAANDTSVSVRGNVIWKVLRKYRGSDLVLFYKERLVSETDESIILSSIPGLLKDHPSPQNYLFIKDRFNSFPDFVKSSLIINGFNEYSPRKPSANISATSLIDSLLSYNTQCTSLSWLGNVTFSSQLQAFINDAQSKLNSGDSLGAAIKIKQYQSAIVQAYQDPVTNTNQFVTSDGYKFLYYYPKYILERLPEVTELRNDLTAKATVEITNVNGNLQYSYTITSEAASNQSVANIYVEDATTSTTTTPTNWQTEKVAATLDRFYTTTSASQITAGTTQGGFTVTSYSLPVIGKVYIQSERFVVDTMKLPAAEQRGIKSLLKKS